VFVTAIIVTVLSTVFLDQILIVFGATETLMPYVKDYMSIVILATLFFMLTNTFNNVIRTEGRAKQSMYLMMVGLGINLILDPIFIFDWGFGLGIQGAAIATFIGFMSSALYGLIYVLRNKENTVLYVNPLKFGFDLKTLVSTIKIGLPSLLRNIVGSVIAIVVIFTLRNYALDPDLYISIYGTINKIIMVMFLPSFGMVKGMQPIISYNYGAKQYDRVIEVVKIGMKYITIFFVVGFLVLEIFPKEIISLFIKAGVPNYDMFISESSKILRIMMIMLPLISVQIVAAMLYQAIGKAKEAIILSFSKQALIMLIIIILPSIMGLLGIWITFPLADITAAIVSYIFIRHEFKVLREKMDEIKKKVA